MRILITTPPGLGHIHPMIPLALALQARGHDVLCATGADGGAWFEAAGLRRMKAGVNTGEAAQEFWRRHPEVRSLPPQDIPKVMFGGMFGGVAAPAMLADLLPLAREWQPELVLHDAAELAGPIIAGVLGVPNVCKSFGPLLPQQRVAGADDYVAPLWRAQGLEPRPYAGSYDYLYLDIYPRGLQPPLGDYVGRTQPLRPVPSDAMADVETADIPVPAGHEDVPLVYLTMGTVFNDAEVLRPIVDGLAALPIRLLVTVGPRNDPAAMGDQPTNVRVESYVPQTLVLHRCRVVISHGGSGTTLATLALGLPQLCLPQGADQFDNGRAVESAGAGLSLIPAEANPHAIVAAVTRLLAEEDFRRNAQRVGDEIASMPGPEEVAAVLEELTTTS